MSAVRGGGRGGRPQARGAGSRIGRRDRVVPKLVELVIEGVGRFGDGVAMHEGKPVYVPYTAQGDLVLVRIEGKRGDGMAGLLIEVLEPGPIRAEPPCRHFGACGGCALQHLSPESYQSWKRGLVAVALARQGFTDLPLAPLVTIPPGTRRRAAFAFARVGNGVMLGFNARATHKVVDIEECLLVEPRLAALLPPLRAMLSEVVPPSRSGDVVLTQVDDGLDVLIEVEATLDLFDREKLTVFAEANDLSRLSWRRPGAGGAEPLVVRRPATVRLGDVAVELPPGAFLQPSVEGERIIAALVAAAVGDAPSVVDLFAGCGTLTFPLAHKAKVHAVEGDVAALAALKSAADHTRLPITTEARDLARRPLLPDEMKRFAAAVFDPPRAGAPDQADQLAKGGPSLVVAVSCNPVSFAHDARLLAEGGYQLQAVTPIDQFPWSAHVEMVGVFKR